MDDFNYNYKTIYEMTMTTIWMDGWMDGGVTALVVRERQRE